MVKLRISLPRTLHNECLHTIALTDTEPSVVLQAWLSLLVPALAAGVPTQTYHQPAYHQPAYHQPAYHQPAYHQPAYHGYEHPKHNCSVLDVVEPADVCTNT